MQQAAETTLSTPMARAAIPGSRLGTINLGHTAGIGVGVGSNASGLGISADGKTLVVANNYNDSISVIDTASRTVRYEHDLRPFFTNNEGQRAALAARFPSQWS